MNIQNITQFASFISDHDLVKLDSTLLQIINCLNTYKSACSCYKSEDKLNLYNSCNAAYMVAVKTIVPKFKFEFLSKTYERQISFLNDKGHIIGIISR